MTAGVRNKTQHNVRDVMNRLTTEDL